jgi:hypothetical protein
VLESLAQFKINWYIMTDKLHQMLAARYVSSVSGKSCFMCGDLSGLVVVPFPGLLTQSSLEGAISFDHVCVPLFHKKSQHGIRRASRHRRWEDPPEVNGSLSEKCHRRSATRAYITSKLQHLSVTFRPQSIDTSAIRARHV